MPVAISEEREVQSGVQPLWLGEFAAIVCAIALAFPLFGYAYLGQFTRPVADDYCAGRNLAQHGFWGSQVWTYRNHSGRFFSYFVRIGAEFLGHQHIVPFVAATMLIAWLAATTWAFLQCAKILEWQHGLLNSVVLSELFLFAMLRTGPDTGQSFFWEDGSLTYTLPIFIITLYLGLLLYYVREQPQGTRRTAILLLAGTLCFFAAGTSETNAAFQCIGLFGAILILKWARIGGGNLKRSLPVLYAGLLGSVVSSVLVIIAPGNAVREAFQRNVVAALPLAEVVKESFRGSAALVFDFLRHRPLAAVAMLGVPAILTWLEKSPSVSELRWRDALSTWLLACLFSFALIFGCTFPGVYALATLPPDRAQFISQWILLATLLFTGVASGRAARHWSSFTPNFSTTLVASLIMSSLILLWVAKSARSIATATRESRLYASEWDFEDTQIRHQKADGVTDIVVPWNATIAKGGNVDNAPWLSADPKFYVNTCQADYYGVRSFHLSGSDTRKAAGAGIE